MHDCLATCNKIYRQDPEHKMICVDQGPDSCVNLRLLVRAAQCEAEDEDEAAVAGECTSTSAPLVPGVPGGGGSGGAE